MKNKLMLYVHGKGGSGEEAERYREVFPHFDVVGLDYRKTTPWEARQEIYDAVRECGSKYKDLYLIANSIGAFFSMNAGIDEWIRKAFFISPIVDMERLILDMMRWEKVTEADLQERQTIHTSFGEDLSWAYLSYVRAHPIHWSVPTEVLYGENDALTSHETISAFVEKHRAGLTVMPDGEHWFHTLEQLSFSDHWLREKGADLSLDN